MNETLRSALHVITENLENPAIIILICLMVLIVVLVGEAVAEYFVTRFRKKLDMPMVLLELGDTKSDEEKLAVIRGYRFQGRQSKIFERVLCLPEDVADETRKTLAVQLIMDEDIRTDKRLFVTKVISRVGPMLGLMATLIPLGPGLQALGDGDPKGLSDAMLMAFDATVIGLASAIIAFIIFELKKGWYKGDLNATETVLEEMVR
jgi:biopolymer transport protein ExbB/TolQ